MTTLKMKSTLPQTTTTSTTTKNSHFFAIFQFDKKFIDCDSLTTGLNRVSINLNI